MPGLRGDSKYRAVGRNPLARSGFEAFAALRFAGLMAISRGERRAASFRR